MKLIKTFDNVLMDEVVNVKGFTVKAAVSCNVYVDGGRWYVEDVQFTDGYIWFCVDWVTKEWRLAPYKGSYLSALVIDELVTEIKHLALQKTWEGGRHEIPA